MVSYNAEHCESCAIILDSLVNGGVFGNSLLICSFLELGHPGIEIAEVYFRETYVE